MKKALAFLLLTSVLLRLWFALGYWQNKPLTQDAKEYMELAASFNETGRFEYEEHDTLQIESYGRAPGYPFWLAMLTRFETTLAWIRLVEVLVNLISAYLFFLLARELFGFRPGVSALIIATFYLPFLTLIPPILSENLWICFMLLAYLFLIKTQTQPDVIRARNMLACVFFLAIATLIRPGAVFLLPFFAFWLYRSSGIRKAILAAAIYFLLLTPWNLYLYLLEGRFIFVASEGGVTFWVGTHPDYKGDGDLSVNPAVQKEYREILREYADSTPTQKEKLFFQKGVQNILQHPLSYLLLEGKKLIYAFFPVGPSVWKMSWMHKGTSLLFYFPVLLAALLAIRTASPQSRIFAAGIAASYVVMILLFFPQERFRIAVLDPVLMLFAASELSRRVRGI